MKKKSLFVFLFCAIAFSTSTVAEPLALKKGDTIADVLKTKIGKKVSVKTKSGSELSGKVLLVGKNVTHLGELTGKEFYDAVIVNKDIEAVIIRTK